MNQERVKYRFAGTGVRESLYFRIANNALARVGRAGRVEQVEYQWGTLVKVLSSVFFFFFFFFFYIFKRRTNIV